MVAGKLDLVPRYRQKVRFVPLAVGSPAWIDDPHFSLDYHLRHTAIPAPGSEEQLRQMAGRVFSQHLDRNKPLWELWMVEGLNDGRWALLSKVHHCMVDGVAATDLMSVMFSDTTTAPRARRVVAPAPEPSGIDVLVRTLARTAPARPVSWTRCGRRCARRAKRCARSPRSRARRLPPAPSLRPVAASSLTGPIGPHRRWSWAEVRLTDVKAVRAELGGTVNDVVLTVITNGFRDAARIARRGDRRGPGDPHDGPGVGAPARREGRLQQPRLGGVRRAAGRAAGPGPAPGARSAPRWTASSSPSRPSPETS